MPNRVYRKREEEEANGDKGPESPSADADEEEEEEDDDDVVWMADTSGELLSSENCHEAGVPSGQWWFGSWPWKGSRRARSAAWAADMAGALACLLGPGIGSTQCVHATEPLRALPGAHRLQLTCRRHLPTHPLLQRRRCVRAPRSSCRLQRPPW